MLHAVLRGKAARVEIDGKDVSWRELFRAREDLLTAALFGRFAYLSHEAQRQVLELLIGKEAAANAGGFREANFWPRFNAPEGNGSVEPDVVLHFDHIILVVEVKPPEGGTQRLGQWRNELAAVLNTHFEVETSPGSPSELVFLALGRNTPAFEADAATVRAEFSKHSVVIRPLEWERLFSEILALHSHSASAELLAPSDKAVFADWLRAMEMYGIYRPRKPFTELLLLPSALNTSLLSVLDAWQPMSTAMTKPESRSWETLNAYAANNRLVMLHGQQ